MTSVPRAYTPRARAESQARTRARIVDAARRLLPTADSVSVDEIARAAGVSVQTLYTHFGSKRGLLLAAIDAEQRAVGAYVDFGRVWQSPDGETALRRMLEATIRLWDRAWALVEFTERARRADREIGRVLREVDGYRRSNLRSITDRLGWEQRLRAPLDPEGAADLAFALSVPAAYEELVRIRGWAVDRAAASLVGAAVAAVIDADTRPVTDPPADWSTVLEPRDVLPSEA